MLASLYCSSGPLIVWMCFLYVRARIAQRRLVMIVIKA